MTITRPTGEQLVFKSARTGEHVLDSYLESCEIGNRPIGDLLGDIFNEAGVPQAHQFQVVSNVLQYRLGSSSWVNLQDWSTYLQRASDWADKPSGEVEPGRYSSRYWSDVAGAAALNAFTYRGEAAAQAAASALSASESLTHRSQAALRRTEAETAAAAAAASAASAAGWTGGAPISSGTISSAGLTFNIPVPSSVSSYERLRLVLTGVQVSQSSVINMLVSADNAVTFGTTYSSNALAVTGGVGGYSSYAAHIPIGGVASLTGAGTNPFGLNGEIKLYLANGLIRPTIHYQVGARVGSGQIGYCEGWAHYDHGSPITHLQLILNNGIFTGGRYSWHADRNA